MGLGKPGHNRATIRFPTAAPVEIFNIVNWNIQGDSYVFVLSNGEVCLFPLAAVQWIRLES